MTMKELGLDLAEVQSSSVKLSQTHVLVTIGADKAAHPPGETGKPPSPEYGQILQCRGAWVILSRQTARPRRTLLGGAIQREPTELSI